MPSVRRHPSQLISRVTFDPQRTDPELTPEMLTFAEDVGLFDPNGRLTHDPIVYYMRMDRLVKIGTTIDITSRISNIMPQGVMAVEHGDRAIERGRHQQFAETHSHGEWYWMDEALGVHIVQVREQFEALVHISTEAWIAQRARRT